MHINEKIKKARLDAGLTPAALAKKIGVPRTTYLYWEEKTPTIEKIKQVALALGKVENYFFDSSDNFLDTSPHHKSDIESKYIARLEKDTDKYEKLLEEKEADLTALRSALEKINTIQEIKITVNGLQERIEDVETNFSGLQGWLIDEFSKLKKESPESVAASIRRKKVALSRGES